MGASDSRNDYLRRDMWRLVGSSPTVIRMWENLGRARPGRSARKPIALNHVSMGIYALTF